MFLVIDFEATCWKDNLANVKNPQNEIIEVGAVLVGNDYKVIGSTYCFIKPTINTVLSNFCKELTTITQDQIDNADVFYIAWPAFQKDIESLTNERFEDIVFCSWGYYDKKQLAKDCKLHNIPFPFKYHFSVKHEFATRRKIKPCGVSKAIKFLDMEFDGTLHRGIDDARNIAKIFIKEWAKDGFKVEEKHKCNVEELMK